MLTIMIWKVLYKASKQKYFIEIILLIILLLAGCVIYFQYEYMEAYGTQEDTVTHKIHDLTLENTNHPYSINNQWQEVKGTRHELRVYSAYYDNREGKKLIRIIGSSEPNFHDEIQCQLFFQNSEVEHSFVLAKVEPIIKNIEAELVAVFVTCALPENSQLPRAVSVTARSGAFISNLLLVQWFLPRAMYQNKNTASVVACVEPLDSGYSQVVRLMEFIELNRILGVDHFIFYKQSVSENLNCLLKDYIRQGRITVIEWNFPKKETSPENEVQHEGKLAAFNDCLYQTMSKYEYAIFLSIDEFIIPKETKSLKDLIRTKENQKYYKYTGAFVFKVANFYLEWPDENWRGRNYMGFFLMTLYKIYQTTTDSNNSTKAVCKPKAVLQVGAQNDVELISGYHSMNVEELQGLCHRYRQAPRGHTLMPVAQALRDTSAHRFTPRLMRALAMQYHISMPHCTLPIGNEDVKIQHFGPNNVPILLDNLVAK